MKKILLLLAIFSSIVFAKEALNVYTYSSFITQWGPGPAIKKSFEKKCNCTLNFIALDDSVSILSRLRLEGKNTKADVILGLDKNSLKMAMDTKLIAKHNINLSKLQLPIPWTDEYFLPYDYGYFTFIYDSKTTNNLPKSFNEFLSDDRKLIYIDPRTSSVGLGLLLWIKKIYGENSFEAWEKIAKKTLSVTKGWGEAYNMFLNGEAPFVLSYTTSPAFHLVSEQEDRYKALNFHEGHYLQVEIAAKLNTSKKQKLADEFLSFIISEEFQKHIPTGNWMYPVININLPKEFSTLAKVKPLEFKPEEVFKYKKMWVRDWQNIVSE